MRERAKGRNQQQAAAKAGLGSAKTVRKYEKLGLLPSQSRRPRTYRTRTDPFEGDWSLVADMLEQSPELEAKALFDWLCERHPGRYHQGQLRTFQRRVSTWRALKGDKDLSLDQTHQPGEVLQSDGTNMNDLAITIAGAPLPHLLLHCVLPYSNWEWARVVQSESLLSIRLALQSALFKLGHLPRIHQTDNTTAATHNLGGDRERGYNEEYRQFLAHYQIEPRTIHCHRPDENGDVESANGQAKAAIRQHLLLRGSRDFPSLEAYEAFIATIMDKRNAARKERLAEELARMRPLTVAPWPLMRELVVRVNGNGLIRVGENGYSVPSGLRGKRVVVRLYEWHLEVWYANQKVEEMPRFTGRGHYRVNYRHVIATLLRKPGGFRHYRYREELFPRQVFRRAWEELEERLGPRRADLCYLRLLKLAAGGLETDVALALEGLVGGGTEWDDTTVAALVRPEAEAVPALEGLAVDLGEYDRLLGREGEHVAA